jgi:hypothetical protein
MLQVNDHKTFVYEHYVFLISSILQDCCVTNMNASSYCYDVFVFFCGATAQIHA